MSGVYNFAKRKRNSKDKRCLFFSDDLDNGLKGGDHVSRNKLSSAIKSWDKCGDGFLGTSAAEKGHSWKIAKVGRELVPPYDQVKGSEVDIAWNSSESEISDGEIPQSKPLTKVYEEVHKIDWDSDLTDGGEEEDSLPEISDSDSSSKQHEHPPKVILAPDVEISDFSDGERAESTAQARCKVISWKPGKSNRRSASDWVRSAQAILQTPQKQRSSLIKSPEDSAKKKRNFLSGGLAERLSRLQCRQRSAISFWRHQSISDCTTPAAGKTGVLSLKLQSVWEDCGMHVALCQGAETSASPCPSGTGQLLVLFNRDTAAHLAPTPGDTVHVYPQWQKLVMEGESYPVILNTHFSQKVLERGACEGGRLSTGTCTPYPLTRVFHLMENHNFPEESPAAKKQREPWDGGETVSDSLLEVIEGHGVAGWMGRDVSVVVQRVYCLHIYEPSSQPLLKHKLPKTDPLLPKYRLCLLVQDAYGLFSEVVLNKLSSDDGLQQLIRKWEGSWCVLRGMKVLQRATRARAAGLFSLIDSLWPPVVPLRVHGKAHSSQDDRSKLPAPSFCYLLSAQRGEDSVDELLIPAPGLYQPAVVHTLAEILQRVPRGHRCSFTAMVVFQRQQGSGTKQGEFWLFVTDPSLQRVEEQGKDLRRTLGVCVSSSCVLHSAVLKALNSSSFCTLTFKDAIREDGLIQCIERSVIQLETLTSAPSSDSPGSEGPSPAHPVKLDLLGPTTTANSLCTLKGVVVGVDEDTAYSWPICNVCDSDQLEALQGERQALFCSLCNSTIVNPKVKMQLEVFLRCTSFSQCTVKIKLLQNTIMSVLNSTPPCSEGYAVENVLGKEVGPLTAYVRVITRKAALWVGLEEISFSKGCSDEALQETGPAHRNERERI
ncbi:hypothetical protein GJAV_G00096090 [Gymnothorax javanicus]|nr:hypothetical protein GJAV_G00096090 [Gymnothorax javanicus]